MNALAKEELVKKANIIRQDILKMLGEAGSGHPGGSLSGADIVAALYFKIMNIRPEQPDWEDRDRFILSKGHAAPLLYAALANKGYFPKDELWSLRKIGSMLQGHPDRKSTPGVEMSTGSLGQGFSTSIGMALAGKLDKRDYQVYVLLGDGEIEEGIVWEAAMAAAHYKLDNLCAIVDHNKLQIDGFITDVMSPEPIHSKFGAFGWHVLEIDGHNMEQILNAFDKARNTNDKPTMILANTIKGKGVSFMEGVAGWHGKTGSAEDVKKALAEIENTLG